MPQRTPRVATLVVTLGVVLTLVAALAVVAIGRSTGSSDLVVLSRDELADLAPAEPASPYQLEEIARFDTPTALAPRPGSEDLYVSLLGGQVMRLVPDGAGGFTASDAPVLDIADQVSAQPGIEGLVNLVFSPDGNDLYLAYTDKAHDQVVAAHPVTEDGAGFGPGQVILTIDTPDGIPPNNHVGGGLTFGPDGDLYVGVGDAGAGAFSATDPESLFGKVLRIIPDPVNGGYTTPDDNTFDRGNGRPEIWTLGMRNPWRIDFDPPSGDLWIADVGEEQLEEINRLEGGDGAGRGVNLGWPQYAGSAEYRTDQPSRTDIPPSSPSYEYDHREGRCAVVGGAVYRGTQFTDLVGDYLFSDVCSKALLGLREAPDGGYEEFTLATTEEAQMASVDAGNDGTIYLTSMTGGVYRLVPAV